MQKQFFFGDKNYILKEVQSCHRDLLLYRMVEQVKNFYLTYHNPLGLIDDTIKTIQSTTDYSIDHLEEYYTTIATFYRYLFGEVQLEFLFDGRSHTDKYSEDWTEYFKKTVHKFCFNDAFVKAVLEASIFDTQNENQIRLSENRMKVFLEKQFALKLTKRKGIVSKKAS